MSGEAAVAWGGTVLRSASDIWSDAFYYQDLRWVVGETDTFIRLVVAMVTGGRGSCQI